MARAFALQAKGYGFESRCLHNPNNGYEVTSLLSR